MLINRMKQHHISERAIARLMWSQEGEGWRTPDKILVLAAGFVRLARGAGAKAGLPEQEMRNHLTDSEHVSKHFSFN